MGSDWKAHRLGDLVTHQKGHAFKSKDYREHGHGIVRVSDFTDRSVDTDSCNYLAQELAHNYDSVALKQGDVVIATVGSWPTNPASVVGKTIQVPREADSFLLNQNAVKLTANEALDQAFLFHLLKTETFQAYIVSAAQGSASQASITLKSIFDFDTPLPPLPEQKAIAHILGSLDDKIELNRRMNATLEGMAQALFKSWFVDFDPVIDNALAAGNPIPDELAPRAEVRRQALSDQKAGTTQQVSVDHPTLSDRKSHFPAAFQFTEELGWIPEGWEPREVGDFAEIKHGYAFKGEYFTSERTDDILVTPGNFRIGGGFKSDKLKYYDGPIAEDYVLTANDLIVTMTDLSKVGDTLGYPAFIPPSDQLTYHHNQRVGLVNLKTQEIGNHYLYQIFKSTAYRDEILGSMSGSTVKHTSPSKISAFKFPFSGGALEQGFEEHSRAIEAKITLNDSASETLTKFRDTLLPKLISGEIAPSSTAVQGTELFSYAQEVTS